MDVLVLDEMEHFDPTRIFGPELFDYLVADFLEDLGEKGRKEFKRMIEGPQREQEAQAVH